MDGTYAVGIAVAAFVAAGFLAAYVIRITRHNAVRRVLVGLVGRREEIRSAIRALEVIAGRLSLADDARLTAYANDETDEDRAALHELGNRMRLFAEDLWQTSAPELAATSVERMSRAAMAVSDQALCASLDSSSSDALDGLAALDLGILEDSRREMDAALDPLLAAYGIDDASVYGGGLYI